MGNYYKIIPVTLLIWSTDDSIELLVFICESKGELRLYPWHCSPECASVLAYADVIRLTCVNHLRFRSVSHSV